MSKVYHCPCGFVVRGSSDDEFVSDAYAHILDSHPDLVGTLTREELLAMATEGG